MEVVEIGKWIPPILEAVIDDGLPGKMVVTGIVVRIWKNLRSW